MFTHELNLINLDKIVLNRFNSIMELYTYELLHIVVVSLLVQHAEISAQPDASVSSSIAAFEKLLFNLPEILA